MSLSLFGTETLASHLHAKVIIYKCKAGGHYITPTPLYESKSRQVINYPSEKDTILNNMKMYNYPL